MMMLSMKLCEIGTEAALWYTFWILFYGFLIYGVWITSPPGWNTRRKQLKEEQNSIGTGARIIHY